MSEYAPKSKCFYRINQNINDWYRNKNRMRRSKKLKIKLERFEALKGMKKVVGDHDNWICYLCEKKGSYKEMSIDHIKPVSRNGSNELSNLRIAHKECNLKKGNMSYIGYLNNFVWNK